LWRLPKPAKLESTQLFRVVTKAINDSVDRTASERQISYQKAQHSHQSLAKKQYKFQKKMNRYMIMIDPKDVPK